MPILNETPINKPFLTANNVSREWELFFSQLGDGLNGKWEMSLRNLNKVNLNDIPSRDITSYQGRELSFSFVWENGATFSNSSMLLDIENGRGDFTMEEGYLQVWDGPTLVNGAYCKDLTIELPDLVTNNKIIIQGKILTKKQY